MRRRDFIRASGAGLVATGLAGCITETGDGGNETEPTDDGTEANGGTDTPAPDYSGTLRVATYESFVDSPSASPAGPWLKDAFESEYPDATVEYTVPDNGVNQYIQRRQQGAAVDADVYVGLNVDDLIRLDENLDDALFAPVDESAVENVGHVKEPLWFDPDRRAIPYDTGYISLVYDENETSNPETFEALLDPAFEDQLLVQNAQTDTTGRAFLLWTVHAMSEDGYLDYWDGLVDNGARIVGSWDDSYTAYSEGEAPMVVSYSTDQVYANRYDQDMSRHQVGFLNDQGYANPEGMAKFVDAENDALADAFLDFLLSAEAQGEIAMRNVQFPATDWAELDEEFETYAHEPPEPVTFDYDELAGNVDGWVDDWARRIAER